MKLPLTPYSRASYDVNLENYGSFSSFHILIIMVYYTSMRR